MKTVDYTAELFAAVMENMADYHQMSETVCGAEDPAVITLLDPMNGFTVVRVVNRYVNPWNSKTLLIFSNVEMTPEEYADYEELADELAEG